jgi:phenylalanyl-tRNA synthetase alpha chain
MKKQVDAIRQSFNDECIQQTSSQALEQQKVKYLGRKGLVQGLVDALREVPKEQKPEAGKLVNELKREIEEKIEIKKNELIQKEESLQLAGEKIDITLPGKCGHMGSKHPVMAMIDRMVDIFRALGFSVQPSPELETDYYNFEVLNFPPDHPARDMQDTFYIDPQVLLRTHCTTFQGRVFESVQPPIRVINPGRCFRNETVSSRSHVFFHQVDGAYVDKKVSLGDLISTFDLFLDRFFEEEIVTRYRPSFFPFVEPGVEIDVSCMLCKGKGCMLCKHSGWLEICGAGMIHPQVFRNTGIDPELYNGFAWGLGVERLVLLRYAITDIRHFTANDMRFLQQFSMV